MFNDFELAKKLQEDEHKAAKWNQTSKTKSKGSAKENTMQPSSLIDPTWELIDPNPNIHSLFIAFDKKYFWNTLGAVEVKWSPRMYSCAGICTYKGRGGCVVSLSLPLLKLRPRKDLIETLLHEMIHAYLFLTKNDRDRDGHGPQFHSHMYRINAEAGTNITVYHTFHDEVRHYKTHWWRCDGPCRLRKPFFGIVKRAMNRAPGPNDFWFPEHQSTCGGNFIKIQEPEGFKSRKKKSEVTSKGSTKQVKPVTPKKVLVPSPSIRNFFNDPKKSSVPSPQPKHSGLDPPSKNGHPKPKMLNFPSTSSKPPSVSKPVGKTNIAGVQNGSFQFNGKVNKINNTSNIHGFGTLAGGGAFRGGLKSNMGGTLIENPKSKVNGKSNDPPGSSSDAIAPTVQPFSGKGYVLSAPGATIIDRSRSKLLSLYSQPPHKKPKVDDSLCKPTIESKVDSTHDEPSISLQKVPCPVCGIDIDSSKINEHLDSCVQMDLTEEPVDVTNLPPSPSKSLFAHCPVCGKSVYKTKVNEHIDECIQNNSFEDLSSDVDTNRPSCSSSSFTADPPSPSKGLFANCPVCDKKVYKNKMDEHLDSCIRLDSIMDSSGCEIVDLDVDEGDSREVKCPCCDKVFSPSDINAHLDTCLHYR
uniref:Protein with SprT-like domain at the N terminus n=2 Tax=Lygus hesperus TaxID=30085 RepID=A0A146KJH6_LYGHE